MLYKALVSFTGKVTMAEGDVGEIPDITVAEDLLKAGYIEEIKKEPKKKEAKSK